jgi:hypothetical protein
LEIFSCQEETVFDCKSYELRRVEREKLKIIRSETSEFLVFSLSHFIGHEFNRKLPPLQQVSFQVGVYVYRDIPPNIFFALKYKETLCIYYMEKNG